jgi:hypothetical protein
MQRFSSLLDWAFSDKKAEDCQQTRLRIAILIGWKSPLNKGGHGHSTRVGNVIWELTYNSKNGAE